MPISKSFVSHQKIKSLFREKSQEISHTQITASLTKGQIATRMQLQSDRFGTGTPAEPGKLFIFTLLCRFAAIRDTRVQTFISLLLTIFYVLGMGREAASATVSPWPVDAVELCGGPAMRPATVPSIQKELFDLNLS